MSDETPSRLGETVHDVIARVKEKFTISDEVTDGLDAASAVSERPPRRTVQARGVPELHLRHVYDREPMECQALAKVKAFLDGDSMLLVLSGGVGTCKTGSAAWALTMKPGKFITADDLPALAAARAEDLVREYKLVRSCQLLVLDDLGAEFNDDKGWFERALTSLINARYSAALKTIMTTNLAVDKFREFYGERVADRIRECGSFVTIGGKSVRNEEKA